MSKRSGRNSNRPTNIRRRVREIARLTKKHHNGKQLINREQRLFGSGGKQHA